MNLKGSLIAEKPSKEGQVIKVWQNSQFRWLCIDNDTIQSVMSRATYHQLVSPLYQHMLAALLFKPNPGSILFLGLGGGDLSRFFHHYSPQISLQGVELNSTVIKIAKSYFSLPRSLKIYHQGAHNFVSTKSNKQSDMIFVDLFTGSQMSKESIDFEFLSQCHQCLAANGVMVINLSFPNENQYAEGLLQIRRISKNTLFLSIPDYNNLLVFILGEQTPDILSHNTMFIEQSTTLEQQCQIDFMTFTDRLIKQNSNF